MWQWQMCGICVCVFSIAIVPGEDPEFVRAKFFFRDEFLVRLVCSDYSNAQVYFMYSTSVRLAS